ncbi:MAG: flagellar motor protein MotB [Candidatus Zixiibacteriota bacterium]
MLRRRRRDDIPQDNPERWLLTYADLITLLLAFFIVMYSMSQIDAKQFGKVSEALKGILKGGPSVLKHLNESDYTGHGLLKVGDLSMLQTRVLGDVALLGRKGDIVTEVNERGLTIHIMESAMFDEGQAQLKPRARELLDIVARDIVNMPNHVRVEGHTDSRPIATREFPSNWELSTTRATTIVRYLIDQHNFPPEKISAVGYASYRPYVPNTTIENRARNRRVDIVVQTMELSAAEPGNDLQDFAIEQVRALVGTPPEINTVDTGNILPE